MAGLLSESTALQFPDWQREFEVAVCEHDHTKHPELLHAAEAAIFWRLKSRAKYPPGTLERIALNDAIHLLRVMRSENVPYLD